MTAKKTFLEKRIDARDTAIADLPNAVDLVDRTIKFQDLHGADHVSIARALAGVTKHAQLAEMLARMTEDLDDVATYGPHGGR